MPANDFFAFCSSLPLQELRAISKLSRTRHFLQDERVYSAGDPGDELFIVTRGVVEIIPDTPGSGALTLMLSRGDVFGETSAFLQLPRSRTARARAPLGVQCFRSQDFPELLQKVPSFFSFLCSKLAHHLFQAREIGKSQHDSGQLMGSLANFDVVTIYQTVVQSMQTGLLTIADENGESICEFFFDKGLPRKGRFEHLHGEEAFWQLFQTRLGGTFAFSQVDAGSVEWTEKSDISGNADEILLSAVHMRDKFEDLCKRLKDPTVTLKRKQLNFAWSRSDLEDLRPLAEEIWQIAYSQPISLAGLYERCGACSQKVYQAVEEMLEADLFVFEEKPAASPEAEPPVLKEATA